MHEPSPCLFLSPHGNFRNSQGEMCEQSCVCVVFCLSSCGAAADELCLLGKQPKSECYQIFTAPLCVYVSPTGDTVLSLYGDNTPHQHVLFASCCCQCMERHTNLFQVPFNCHQPSRLLEMHRCTSGPLDIGSIFCFST